MMEAWLLRKGRKFPYTFTRRYFRLDRERNTLSYGVSPDVVKYTFRLDADCAVQKAADARDRLRCFVVTVWNKNKPFRVHIGAEKEVSMAWEKAIIKCIAPKHSLRRGTINVSGTDSYNFVVKLNSIKARNLKNIEYFGTIDPRVTFLMGGRKFDTATIEDTREPLFNESWKFLMCMTLNQLCDTNVKVQVWDCNGKSSSDSLIGEVSFLAIDILEGPVHIDSAIRNGKKVTGRIIFDLEMQLYTEWKIRPLSASVHLHRERVKITNNELLQLRLRKSVGTDVREGFISRLSKSGTCSLPTIDSWDISLAMSSATPSKKRTSSKKRMSPMLLKFQNVVRKVIARNKLLGKNRNYIVRFSRKDLPEIVMFGTYDEFLGGGLKISVQPPMSDFDRIGMTQISLRGLLDDERNDSIVRSTSSSSVSSITSSSSSSSSKKHPMKRKRLCMATRKLFKKGRHVGRLEMLLEIDEAEKRQMMCGVMTEDGVRSTSVIIIGTKKSMFSSSTIIPPEISDIEKLWYKLPHLNLNRVAGRKEASESLKTITTLLGQSDKSSMTCFTYSSKNGLVDSQKLMIEIWKWCLEQLRFSSRMKRYLVLRIIYLLRALLGRAELTNQELLGLRLTGSSVKKVWDLPNDKSLKPKKHLEILKQTRKLILETASFSIYEVYRNMSELQEQGDSIVSFASFMFVILTVRFEDVFERVLGDQHEEYEKDKLYNKSLARTLKSATPDVPSPLYIKKQNSFLDILDDVEEEVDDEKDDQNGVSRARTVTDCSVNLLEWRSVEKVLRKVYGNSEINQPLKSNIMAIHSKWDKLFRIPDEFMTSPSTSHEKTPLEGICFDSFVVEWIKHLIRTIGMFRRSGFGRGNIPWHEIPGYSELLVTVLKEMRSSPPKFWRDSLRLEVIPWMLSRHRNLSPFLRVLLTSTNAADGASIRLSIDTMFTWFEHLRNGWSNLSIGESVQSLGFLNRPRLSSTFDFEFFREVLGRILDGRCCTFQVVFKVLSFLYNYFDMFPERESNFLRRWILKNHFFTLLLHWSSVGREFFVNLLVFRLLRRRNWTKSIENISKSDSQHRMKVSPSVRRLKERASSSNVSMYVDELSDDRICLNTTLKRMIVDEIATRVKGVEATIFYFERSSTLKWFVKHIQSVTTESQAEDVFDAMLDSGMLIPIQGEDNKFVTLGTSLVFQDKEKEETTTLEIEADDVMRFCADSDASIDRSGTVLFEIRRMVNAAIRHVRRLLRKAESNSRLDSRFVRRVSSENTTIKNSMNMTSQDISKISNRIEDANRKKEIQSALMGVKEKMISIASVAKSSIDSIQVSTKFETKHENVLKITEHADTHVVTSSLSGHQCDGTGSGSLKYARSALEILERKLIELSSIQSKIDRGVAVSLPSVYWNIKVHDHSGKVVAHDSVMGNSSS